MQPIYKGIWLRLKLTYIYIKCRKDKGEKITIREIKKYVRENLKEKMDSIQGDLQNMIKEDGNK